MKEKGEEIIQGKKEEVGKGEKITQGKKGGGGEGKKIGGMEGWRKELKGGKNKYT